MSSSSPGPSSARAAADSSCAAPWPTATRSGSTPLRRASSASQLLRGRVGCGLQDAARRERDRVHDVGVRQLVPGRAREVEQLDAREREPALLLGALAQLRADLLVAHPRELPVVVERPHASAGGLAAARELGDADAGQLCPAEQHEPDREDRHADHAAEHEYLADHALALVVAGGAAHEDPQRSRVA